MTRLINSCSALVIFLFCVQNSFAQDKAEVKDDTWVSIFNGKNLDGWIPKVTGYKSGENPLDGFRVKDGLLKVDYSDFAAFNGRFGHLFYKQKLSSFILHVEYCFTGEMLPDAPRYCLRNSGVMVCSQSPESMDITQNWPVSIEAQLLGCTDKLKQTTGNICTPGTTISYNSVPTNEHCINANSKYYYNGEWVSMDIVVHSGKEIINVVNGDTILITSEPRVGGFLLPDGYPIPEATLLKEGYIALQAEGQPIDFRNIKLKVLDDENTSTELKAQAKSKPYIKVIDNFDSYRKNKQLAKEWIKIGKGFIDNVDLTSSIRRGGKYSLKVSCSNNSGKVKNAVGVHHSGKWNFTKCNGIQLWFKPDGSGSPVTFELTTDKKENNAAVDENWDFTHLTEKGNTDERWITIPFFNFKRKVTKSHFNSKINPGAITGISIIITGAATNDGNAYYFDELAGAKLQF